MSATSRRREAVEACLKQDGACKITDLASRLGVSPMTIRRDLDLLTGQGGARVYHGVAVLSKARDYRITEAESVRTEEKRRIAKAAAARIRPGETIIIDAGSTAAMTAREIPRDLPLTVICLSLDSFLSLRGNPEVKLVLIGGYYHESSRVFESPEAVALLSRHRAARAFITTSGCREDMGVTCSNPFEIAIKKAALHSSLEKVLLADSSKFNQINTCFFAEVRDFDTVITDSGLPESVRHSLREKGIGLEIV